MRAKTKTIRRPGVKVLTMLLEFPATSGPYGCSEFQISCYVKGRGLGKTSFCEEGLAGLSIGGQVAFIDVQGCAENREGIAPRSSMNSSNGWQKKGLSNPATNVSHGPGSRVQSQLQKKSKERTCCPGGRILAVARWIEQA